jgi:lipopolysaccharide cholinephosphotransferase
MVNKFHYLVFQALRSMHHYKFRMRSQRRGKAVIEALSVLFPKRLLRWGAEKLMRRSNYDESLWVINWCGSWGLREAVERTVFDSGKQLSFEGMSVAVPKQVESYLSSLYGDYMKLPPEEKRIRPHSADIVDLDRSYTSYQNSSP